MGSFEKDVIRPAKVHTITSSFDDEDTRPHRSEWMASLRDRDQATVGTPSPKDMTWTNPSARPTTTSN